MSQTFSEIMAIRRHSLPANWRLFRWQVLGDWKSGERTHYQITGAVCDAKFKSGPRKERYNWAKRDKSTERTYTFSFKEEQEFMQLWEVETGLCSRCMGKGGIFHSWSVSDGTKYKQCRACEGTGKAKTKQAK